MDDRRSFKGMKKSEKEYKICIVSPSLKMGGIERALSILADYFINKGHNVSFISCLSAEKFYELNSNVKFIEPVFKRTNNKINKIIYYPRMTFWLRKEVVAINPDVVLSFGDWFNPLVLLALKGTKYPVFISDRTSPDYPFSAMINIMKKLFYPGSAGFIAQTKRAADYKRQHFGNKLNIKIIPNAVKTIIRYDIPRKKQIVYIGRLSYEKGPDRLLEVFFKIKDKKGWNLVLAGNGPMMKQLISQAEEFGSDDSISFLGQIKDVDRLLAESSIFVMPSRLEGFPNALCEAMGAGLVSICFDCIPSGDIITNNVDGFIVPDGDTSAMAELITILINDEQLRNKISEKAMDINENFSLKKIGNAYLDFMFKSI